MPAPQQPWTSRLDPVKGYFSENALDFQCNLSANVDFVPPPGRCGHLNADGEWQTGVVGGQVPLFIKEDPRGPSHRNAGAPTWYSIIPDGEKVMLLCLVGYAPIEAETTEYADLTYALGDDLRALANDSDADVGGTLTNASVVNLPSASATAIVGKVSKAPAKRQSDRNKVLRFWFHNERGAAGL